jgi:hypothetical protein
MTPASSALQPAFSVINCGGIGTGAGPGTLKVAKQLVRLICLPRVSRPEAAAKLARVE